MTVETIRAAYEAFAAGDIDPLVSLIDPQMEWRGRRRLRRVLAAAPFLTRPR